MEDIFITFKHIQINLATKWQFDFMWDFLKQAHKNFIPYEYENEIYNIVELRKNYRNGIIITLEPKNDLDKHAKYLDEVRNVFGKYIKINKDDVL